MIFVYTYLSGGVRYGHINVSTHVLETVCTVCSLTGQTSECLARETVV